MYEQMKKTGKLNVTGIPDNLKARVEAKANLSLDDVRVHYNSSKPTQLRALAYTQGNQVYIGPGQEGHLAHELGHVVQQKLGMVKPTGSIAGMPLNDERRLEEDADKF